MARISHGYTSTASTEYRALSASGRATIDRMVNAIVAKPTVATIDRKTGKATYRVGSAYVQYTMTAKGSHVQIDHVGV